MLQAILVVLIGAWAVFGTSTPEDALAAHRDGAYVELESPAELGEQLHAQLSGPLAAGDLNAYFTVRHTGHKRDSMGVDVHVWEGEPYTEGATVACVIYVDHAVPARDPRFPIHKQFSCPTAVADPWVELEVVSVIGSDVGLLIDYMAMEQ